MLKFIPNNYDFELDLSYLGVTFNETNSMFNKEFSSDYSFPFFMSIDFWNKITNLHYNSSSRVTFYEGKLYRDGAISDAKLKIQTHKGNDVEGIIFSGLDSFPGFDNKLEDLDLEVTEVEDIKAHALETIVKDYPETTHNFPMVHTDKYDPESEEFNGFQKIMNYFSEGSFVENVLDVETNISTINNILQPFVYLMHVLIKGFEKVGYILEGDILSDVDLARTLVYRDANYYDSLTKENISIRIKNDEHIGFQYIKNGIEHVKFEKTLEIEKKGDYLIFGQISCLRYNSSTLISDISINIEIISSSVSTNHFNHNLIGNNPNHTPIINQKKVFIIDVDLPISLEVGDVVKITKIEPRRDQTPESVTPEYPEAVSLDLIPVRYRNSDGSPIISLLWLNEINLKRCVPDMTFGELIEQIRLYKNYDFFPEGDIVYMNKITLASRAGAVDISKYDIEEPLQTFNDERSYEIKFADGKNSTYNYDSLFVDKSGVKTNVYKTNKNTSFIVIDALPYPVITRNGVTTAHAFDDETSKLRLIFYKAPDTGEAPICYNNENMLIPAVYQNHYFHWLNFLINSVSFEWDFVVPVEIWRDVHIRALVFAYHNYHLFSEIEKERIVIGMEHYYRITARSESLV